MGNEQLFEVNGDKVTDAKVMRSAAGYYVGREVLDEDMGMMMPHDRFTLYFRDPAKADDLLSLYKGQDPKELSVIGLQVVAQIPETTAREFVYGGM